MRYTFWQAKLAWVRFPARRHCVGWYVIVPACLNGARSRVLVTLYKLIACHMMGDYVFQTDFLARTKGENPWHLLVHCVLYTTPFAVAFGIDWRIAWLLVSHLLIDALKARWSKIGYVSDQISHLLAIAVYFL